MATLSNNDIAQAIYEITKHKSVAELKEINNKVVKFLARRRLLPQAKDILERLEKIINDKNETISVNVSSSKELEEHTKKELASFLKKRYEAKEVILKERLNDELIGGIKVEVGDEVIDLTVKNKIKKLQEHLTRKI